jgi:sugar/nucleoside kinase (ribokinase family)
MGAERRRSARVDLVSAGESFEDLVFHGLSRLPRPGEELRPTGFLRTIGGGTIITAVTAARMGCRVQVVSALADEAVGRLRAERIVTRNLRTVGEPHAVTVALSTRSDRAFVTLDGVNAVLEARLLVVFARRLPSARHLHLALGPHDLPAWIGILQRCRAAGITTSWDFGWHERLPRRQGFRALLAALDWVFVNEREAVHYARASALAPAVARWHDLASGTVIKLGRRGAMVLADGHVVRQAARRVRVVDTTGAGDAFNGGFLAAMLAGRGLAACLEAGVRAGTASVTRVGGLP